MLKRFTVENFTSFNGEQTFDLTAGSTTVLPEHVANFTDVKLLKSGVIYGANASGKSNLVKAINFAKTVITSGLPSQDTYKKHFRLSNENLKAKPSLFDFEIEIDGKFYSYGFNLRLQDKEVEDEWLYEIGKTSKRIFSREKNTITLGNMLTNTSLKTRFEIYADDMRNQSDQLFLSEISSKQLEIEETEIINEVSNWFKEKLVVINPNDKLLDKNTTNNTAEMLTKYLNRFNTGIVDVNTITEDFESFQNSLPSELINKIENDLSKSENKKLVALIEGPTPQHLTFYKDTDGNIKVNQLGLIHGKNIRETFELKDESDGTRRLLDFIPLLNTFANGCTVIIDEFDRSLHPKLAREFFELFYELNAENSQLIVTTHESTLLDLNLLRRDEIWFVEKGGDDSSTLYSLNKFKVRYDCKVEKAYLLGRYGAVPVFNNLEIGTD